MAGGIIYLDIDDEITSAAARVRSSDARRVALVLPYGSRVATSRINFRLLSRDALINEKQLAIVAGDPATRALAASAGLPVFGSVGEYESSFAGPRGRAGTRRCRRPTRPRTARRARPAGANGQAPPRRRVAGSHGPPVRGAATAAAPCRSRLGRRPPRAARPCRSACRDRVAAPPAGVPSGPAAARLRRSANLGTSSLPGRAGAAARGCRSSWRSPCSALVVLVGGVGAYVLLPSATIVVTPRARGRCNRSTLTVTADPTATAPDATSLVVPAVQVPLDVTVSDTFPATGKRVEETKATGQVRFSNLDFLRTNTVAGGSIVSTNAGVRFRTNCDGHRPARRPGRPDRLPGPDHGRRDRRRPGRRRQRRAEHDRDRAQGRGSAGAQGRQPRRHERRHARRVPEGRPGRRRRRAQASCRPRSTRRSRTGWPTRPSRHPARRSSARRRCSATPRRRSIRRRSSTRRSPRSSLD